MLKQLALWGKAMMGTGESEGDNRAMEAADTFLNNPLLMIIL